MSKIAGLTTGRVEVLGYDGSPGFSVSNGFLRSESLPYPINTAVLREYQPGAGAGYLDTRLDVRAFTPFDMQQQAIASLDPGRKLVRYYPAAGIQADGSTAFLLVVADDLGATRLPLAGAFLQSEDGTPQLSEAGLYIPAEIQS